MPRPKAIMPVAADKKFIRMIVYGDPGCGKTVLAGTSPNCLILDADEGTESAAAQNSSAVKWVMRDYDDLLEAYEYLRHEGTEEFDWVWLDSISLFQEKGLDQVMADLVAAKPHRKLWLPDKGEYGANMNRLKLMIRNIKALPIHFGITAHVLRTEDDEDHVLYMPWIQGKNMPDTVCGYMNIVGYMTAKRKEGGDIVRRLRTQKDAKHYAKDRFGAVEGVMINPTIPKLMEKVAAVLPSKTKPTAPSRRTTRRRSAA